MGLGNETGSGSGSVDGVVPMDVAPTSEVWGIIVEGVVAVAVPAEEYLPLRKIDRGLSASAFFS